MAINMGFGAAISGLASSAKSLEVTGNNIANTSTVGFKSARAEFSDVLAQSISGGLASQRVGMGSNPHAVVQQFQQGNLRRTENPLDMAIGGRGFFMLDDAGNDRVTYTRNGQFHLEGEPFAGDAAATPEALNAQRSRLMSSMGLPVLGYAATYGADPMGEISRTGDPVPLTFEPFMPSQATTQVTMAANFSAGAAEIDATVPFDTANSESYHYSRAFNAVDAEGATTRVDLYFRKTGFGAWEMNVVEGGVPQPTPYALTFDARGQMVSGQSQALTLGVGAVTLDLSGSTQYGGAFSLDQLTQDGYQEGRLTGMSVDRDGTIFGRYSNNEARRLGQVALADFQNRNGLQSIGDNQWLETGASGTALIGVAQDQNGLGAINAASVEDASVDLNQELVNLIIQQRNYQANAQAIKTQDQILQTLSGIR